MAKIRRDTVTTLLAAALAEAWTDGLTEAMRALSRTRRLGSPGLEIVLADGEAFHPEGRAGARRRACVDVQLMVMDLSTCDRPIETAERSFAHSDRVSAPDRAARPSRRPAPRIRSC